MKKVQISVWATNRKQRSCFGSELVLSVFDLNDLLPEATSFFWEGQFFLRSSGAPLHLSAPTAVH